MSDETKKRTREDLAQRRASAQAERERQHGADQEWVSRIKWADESTRDVMVPEWGNMMVRVRAFSEDDLDGYDLDRLSAEDRRTLLIEVIRNAESPFFGMDREHKAQIARIMPGLHAGVVRRLFNIALRLSGFDA
ncbi:hypothetical protein [Streptomyces scabiei]|uniref:hypothetical protein n=1 Tax=Streptomyces scabiei TaxID=1930 RepID=UPI0029AD9D0A|nr:hypothetical protein [Streptomyces scabiei]MDX3522049.1 hypothetical protein [Streptomyces scabiei]